MKLSRNEKAVVIGVSVIGVGVAASAALIEYLELPKTTPEPKQQKDPLHFEIHIPASKEQFFKSYAEGYSLAKLPLSKIMKFVGQMLVAPIALKALDAVYSAYCDNVNAPQLALEQPTPPKLG